MRKDYFPLPFIDSILDAIASHKRYASMDGFSRYNQIPIEKCHRWYTTMTIDQGTFAYIVMMPFGLFNAPTTIQRIMIEAFQNIYANSQELFLDDFEVFGTLEQHVDCLQYYFDKCMEFDISINVAKSAFLDPFEK